jgi:hypothetical protein
MATTGRRSAIDDKIKGWERELERLRVGLAAGPEGVHAAHQERFVRLYRQKEVLKSRWEAIRGVYRPDPEALTRFEQALAAMEAAWAEAAPSLSAALVSAG